MKGINKSTKLCYNIIMHITAIGGGDKTLAIQHTLDTLPTEKSDVLLIPTACSTPQSHERKVTANARFFEAFGVNVSVLHEHDATVSPTEIEHKIGSAALLYTIGGNTPYMLKTMHEQGIDAATADAVKNGTPHAGTSAGALLLFSGLHINPSALPKKEDWDFTIAPGIGLLRGVATAHADRHDPTPQGNKPYSRMEHLAQNFPFSHDIGIAIDDGAAVVFNGDEQKVIRSTPNANVHILEPSADGTIVTRVDDDSALAVYLHPAS